MFFQDDIGDPFDKLELDIIGIVDVSKHCYCIYC
jgi:hypothetical protein